VTEFESRDATFLENDFPGKRKEMNEDLSLYEIEDHDDLNSAVQLPNVLENLPSQSDPSRSNIRNEELVSHEP
ncbi:hypothetical protein, partial [Vibrio vulnificus]|uniref:hypothetical protein n=1 Tax=Vibrio vulnificus TaxID=672 RepID=UPI0019D44408